MLLILSVSPGVFHILNIAVVIDFTIHYTNRTKLVFPSSFL
ncbi:hypothetical protein BSG1_00005 [Bacillus sp. SG-1]|nr:hypothetical protein BSG1_00005 [Bacillus sp. SG-1]